MTAISPITNAKSIHQQIIDRVLGDWPEAKTKGFMAALKTLQDAEYTQWITQNDHEWKRAIAFIPDAWLINAEDRHVVIFEAIHQHDVPAHKIAKMADLSWALDEDYYRLILVRCERFHRRVYDVQSASLCSELEMIAADEPSQGWHVPDWQKYDSGYCKAFFEESSAA